MDCEELEERDKDRLVERVFDTELVADVDVERLWLGVLVVDVLQLTELLGDRLLVMVYETDPVLLFVGETDSDNS